MIPRKILIITIVLVLISPIFGIILPEILQSEEYIESLVDKTQPIIVIEYPTPFKEYTIQGLPMSVSYAISALIGYGIIIIIYYIVNYILIKKK